MTFSPTHLAPSGRVLHEHGDISGDFRTYTDEDGLLWAFHDGDVRKIEETK